MNDSYVNATDINKFHKAVDLFIYKAKYHRLTLSQLQQFRELIQSVPLALTHEQKESLRALKELKPGGKVESNTLLSKINAFIPDFFFPKSDSGRYVQNLAENRIFGEIFQTAMRQGPSKTQAIFQAKPIMDNILSQLHPDDYRKMAGVFKGNVPVTENNVVQINSNPGQSLKALGYTDVSSLIPFIQSHGSRLNILNLSEFRLSNKEIAEIAPYLSNLKQLTLNADNLNDTGMAEIAGSCKKLTTLELSNCYQVTDDGVGALVDGLKSLTAMHLEKVAKITDKGVATITRGLPGLTALTITSSYEISKEGFKAIAERLTGLTSLNLGNTRLSNDGIAIIAKSLKQLKHLNLSQCYRIKDSIIPLIVAEMPQLKSVDLSSNAYIGDPTFIPMPQFGGLEQINLYWTSATFRTYLNFKQNAPHITVRGISEDTGRHP